MLWNFVSLEINSAKFLFCSICYFPLWYLAVDGSVSITIFTSVFTPFILTQITFFKNEIYNFSVRDFFFFLMPENQPKAFQAVPSWALSVFCQYFTFTGVFILCLFSFSAHFFFLPAFLQIKYCCTCLAD